MLKKTSLFLLTTMIISCGTNFIAFANTVSPKLSDNNKTEINLEDSTNHLPSIARPYEIDNDTIALKESKSDNTSDLNESTSEYIATYTMEATAYAGHGQTASGVPTNRDASGLSTIAVDPKVIPLGSIVYIPDYGYALASDTGGAIKGNKIDLFLNSEEECIEWGRQPVTLHLVAHPDEN